MRFVSVISGVCAALVTASPTFVTASTIYRCSDDSGRAVFSQAPCGHDAKPITLMTTLPDVTPATTNAHIDQSRQYNGEVARRLEVEKIDRAIGRLETKRRNIVKERDTEVARLQKELVPNLFTNNTIQIMINNTLQSSDRKIADVDREIESLRQSRNDVVAGSR